MNEEQRQARINALVKELTELRRQGGDGNSHEALLNECRVLKAQRKPIDAVKLYREMLGCSLREAYEVVNALSLEGKTK